LINYVTVFLKWFDRREEVTLSVKQVQQRYCQKYQQEGGFYMKKMNRRTFITGSAAVGAIAAVSGFPTIPGVAEGKSPLNPPKWAVDLTGMYHEGMPAFAPLDQMFKIETWANFDTTTGISPNPNFYMNRVTIHEHLGTHIDAPAHRIKGGKYLPEIPFERYWMVPAAVINISAKCAAAADYQLTVKDITDWEKKNGRIPDEAWIVVNTGWYKKASDPVAFFNADAGGTWHFPGVGIDAANFIVEERDINGVALDVTSIDRGMDISTGNSTVHFTLLSEEILVVENLINLDELPDKGAVLTISPLLVETASGGPVRVIAALPNKGHHNGHHK
jgi:kynurenine formamidase